MEHGEGVIKLVQFSSVMQQSCYDPWNQRLTMKFRDFSPHTGHPVLLQAAGSQQRAWRFLCVEMWHTGAGRTWEVKLRQLCELVCTCPVWPPVPVASKTFAYRYPTTVKWLKQNHYYVRLLTETLCLWTLGALLVRSELCNLVSTGWQDGAPAFVSIPISCPLSFLRFSARATLNHL